MQVGGKEYDVQGDMLEVGAPAPDFKLTANDFSTRTLADYEGKVKILSVIPSIDTGVCSAQTRRFNEEAAAFGDKVAILTVSADLPYALRRYCGNEGITGTETLSTYLDMAFADDYGVHTPRFRVCQRSVFVLDQDNVLRYAEYVPVMGQEVNFVAALAAAQQLV
ncbi:MAG: thiol peroxidase [Anaerolineaceae bacterium]|nr:thiol peroxidase [Anaerolineaceae bacterium]